MSEPCCDFHGNGGNPAMPHQDDPHEYGLHDPDARDYPCSNPNCAGAVHTDGDFCGECRERYGEGVPRPQACRLCDWCGQPCGERILCLPCHLGEDEPQARHEPIPAGFPVQPLQDGQEATTRATCGHCGLSWDDALSTSYTPVPSGRCPFEYFHVYEDAADA